LAPVAACPRCYALLPYGAATCPSCGAPVGPLPSAPAPAVAPSAAQVPRYQTGYPVVGPPLPPAPTLPLYPGETVLARYSSDPAGSARVIRLNMLIVLGIVLAIFLPFIAITLTGPVTPAIGILFLPLILIGGVMGYGAYNASQRPPTVLFLTDRRAIVEHYGSNASSAAMGLETLGDVRADQNNWATRRAGVVWVYLLPMGTSQPMVGGGRNRHAAPGVVWVPAMPVAQAQELRERVLRQARELQVRLGYPTPPVYGAAPGYPPLPWNPPPPPPPR
jgi:hypothetical protein